LPEEVYTLPALQRLDLTGIVGLSPAQQQRLKAWAQTRNIELIGV
jgi:hypothetical protein